MDKNQSSVDTMTGLKSGFRLEHGIHGGTAYFKGCILASHPAAPCLILGILKNLFFNVAEIYQRRLFEESRQRLENVDSIT